MVAIIIMTEERDCNPFHKGLNMLAIIKNLFWRDSSRSDSYVTLGQFSTLQAYLVLTGKNCNHIWSDRELTLQS